MDVNHAVAAIESSIGDPHRGLPEDIFLFVSRIVPFINVDLLIRDGSGRTLLTWRDDEFFGSGWHVPGGIIRYKEMASDRIQACAREELGAAVAFEAVPLLVSETIQEQRTRGHFISLLYRCRLLALPDEGRRARSNPPTPGQWHWHEFCPPDLLSVQTQYACFL
jgi:ADP-ribose pyrophosphatase YjhB (NUDIX family)